MLVSRAIPIFGAGRYRLHYKRLPQNSAGAYTANDNTCAKNRSGPRDYVCVCALARIKIVSSRGPSNAREDEKRSALVGTSTWESYIYHIYISGVEAV